jgi:hypothetical protein
MMHQRRELTDPLSDSVVRTQLADEGHNLPIQQERVAIGRIHRFRRESALDVAKSLVGEISEGEIERGRACWVGHA